MIVDGSALKGTRWNAFRRGLLISRQSFNFGIVMMLFYGFWCIIGVILAVIYLAFVFKGKGARFDQWMEPVGKFGFFLPLIAIFILAWMTKLVSRLLWCAIPDPLPARLLAVASVIGRLAALGAGAYIWTTGLPLRDALLLPAVIASACVAWGGLGAEWGFMRIVGPLVAQDLNSRQIEGTGSALQKTSGEHRDSGPNGEVDRDAEEARSGHKKGVLKQDVGKLCEKRFPRTTRIVRRLFFPALLVTTLALSGNQELFGVARAIVFVLVIYAPIMQVFWIPGREIAQLQPAAVNSTRSITQ